METKGDKRKTCIVCGEHIDKSDCNQAWVTVIRSSFYLNDKKVKGKLVTFHLNCCPIGWYELI